MIQGPFERRTTPRDSGRHGRASEKKTARRLQGLAQPGSGSLQGAKGDIKKTSKAGDFLIENKATVGASFALQRDWLLKISQEALELGLLPALSFQFTDRSGRSEARERWVAVPEHVFAMLIDQE